MELCYDGTLVMSNGCLVMNHEEMEYIGGGEVYTASQCRQFCAKMAMTGSGLIAAAAGAAIVSTIVRWAKKAGGFIGCLVGSVVGLAAIAVSKIAYGIGYNAVSGRDVSISASPLAMGCVCKCRHSIKNV